MEKIPAIIMVIALIGAGIGVFFMLPQPVEAERELNESINDRIPGWNQ